MVFIAMQRLDSDGVADN